MDKLRQFSGRERDVNALRARFGREEQDSRAIVTALLADPRLPDMVKRFRPAALEAVAPLSRHLIDRINVCMLAARAFDVAFRWPDGTESLNPFAVWGLTTEERDAALSVVVTLQFVVKVLAWNLAEIGLPVDWQNEMDLVSIAQLLLFELDWNRPAQEIANELNLGGSSAFSRDGRNITHRDGRPERKRRNADAIRQAHRDGFLGARFPRLPYASGVGRKQPKQITARLDALSKVLDSFPDATAGKIYSTYGYSSKSCGGLYAKLLDMASRPSLRTLSRDFARLKRRS